MSELDDLLKGLNPEALAAGPSEDPLVTHIVKQQEAAKQRTEASHARWAQCTDHKSWLAEKTWRKQVRKKKEEEIQRKAKEAAIAEEQRKQEEERQRRAQMPQLTPAEEAAAQAKAAHDAAQREAKGRWLENVWQPMFQQRQVQVRASRLEAEERLRQEKEAVLQRQRYEQDGMAWEDAYEQHRLSFLRSECQRLKERQETPRVQNATERKIEIVMEMRGLEIRWKQNLEKRRREEEEERLALLEERKERDYREWRAMVQDERLRRQRLIDREDQRDKEVLEWKSLELLGRDVLREEELKKKAVVEAAFEKSSWQRKHLEEQGIAPQRVLEEARSLAEKQRKVKEEVGPKQAEQELWDALMAKNRLARRSGASTTSTPRWGVFDS